MKISATYLIVMLLCVVGGLSRVVAQPLPLAVAYYDVDGLYDTEKSDFYDDMAYTPEGHYGWTEARYRRKVEAVAAIVDSLALPLVALYGLETEQVVKDVVGCCHNDYAYLHRHQNYTLGRDFVLLYFGDAFSVRRVETHHNAMSVEGLYYGKPLAVVMCNNSGDLPYIVEGLRKRDATQQIIVMGGFYDVDFEAMGLRDVTHDLALCGMGTRVRQGRWQLFDRIATDIDGAARSGVYMRRWLIDENGEPVPTFKGGRYRGGCSSNLPIYAYFDEFFAH